MNKHIMTLNSLAITTDGTPIAETYKLAMEAVSKQSPTQVKDHDKVYDRATCPGCKSRIILKMKPRYCYKCGQAIWY